MSVCWISPWPLSIYILSTHQKEMGNCSCEALCLLTEEALVSRNSGAGRKRPRQTEHKVCQFNDFLSLDWLKLVCLMSYLQILPQCKDYDYLVQCGQLTHNFKLRFSEFQMVNSPPDQWSKWYVLLYSKRNQVAEIGGKCTDLSQWSLAQDISVQNWEF